MNRFIKIIPISFLLLILAGNLFAAEKNTDVVKPAPYFKLISGNNEELTLDDIKGKVAVLFYETKDTLEKNRKLKNELDKFYDEQPDAVKKFIVKLGVINCAGVFFGGAYKSKLREHSKKEGVVIYGDWEGKMYSSYNIKDKESNLIIIDKKGMIRYHSAGKVEEEDAGTIKGLLSALINEK